jgi:4-hydroxy-2-oxoheptanedioate aldolase
MASTDSLKQRLRAGEAMRFEGAPIDASLEQLRSLLSDGHYDLVTVDSQHGPFEEDALAAFCAAAHELDIAVRMRIKHTRDAYLIGHYLDLGLFSVLVPQVETEAEVDEAIEAFYYPPIGKRSWGPHAGVRYTPGRDRRDYAAWWNGHGILCLQLESLDAIANARKLAKPGVDIIAFGPNDLRFSLETYPDPPYASVEDCIRDVIRQIEGTGIRIGTFGLGADLIPLVP